MRLRAGSWALSAEGTRDPGAELAEGASGVWPAGRGVEQRGPGPPSPVRLPQTPAPIPDPHWVVSGVLGTYGHACLPVPNSRGGARGQFSCGRGSRRPARARGQAWATHGAARPGARERGVGTPCSWIVDISGGLDRGRGVQPAARSASPGLGGTVGGGAVSPEGDAWWLGARRAPGAVVSSRHSRRGQPCVPTVSPFSRRECCSADRRLGPWSQSP